jgi:mRNA-degrading endonuclease toxin of MazEF toxin-antitoxin module
MAAGLQWHSMALGHQIRVIDKRRLGACYGILSDPQLRAEIATTVEGCLDLPYL